MNIPTGLFTRTKYNNKETNTEMNTKYKIKTEVRNGNRIAVITPAQAEKILSDRGGNRPLSMDKAKQYAKAMSDGKWKPCSQLSFCNGKLDDGQHRMMASILSGVNFEGTIYHHNDPDTFKVFDIGRKRSNSDTLSVEGKKNATALAATLQVLEKLNSPSGLPNVAGGASRKTIEPYEIMDVLAKYPNIEKSVNISKTYSKYFKIPVASTSILHYYINKTLKESGLDFDVIEKGGVVIKKELADHFIEDKLLKGLELSEDDPVYAFRKYLNKIKATNDIRGATSITHNMIIVGGIQTWNKWVKGKTLKNFKLPESSFMPKILLP